MLYVVTEEGVYRHRILGIFDTQAQAEARARQVAADGKDGYHSYAVSRAALNWCSDDLDFICRFQRKAFGTPYYAVKYEAEPTRFDKPY